MVLNCSYTKPSGLGSWFIHSAMKFKMFSTPLTLTLGSIQAAKQKMVEYFSIISKILFPFFHIFQQKMVHLNIV